MTNLEALKSEVMGYPVQELTLQKILIDNKLSETDEYAGKSKAFELSVADLYVKLCSAANIDEGGYGVSMTDKSNMLTIASRIYTKYGQYDQAKKKPSCKVVRPW